VIYEKTLQATSFGGTYQGFFIQNTAATKDALANTSDGIFVYMNTDSTLPGPGATTYTPTVGDEVAITGLVTEYYNMTELTNVTWTQTYSSGLVLDTVVPATVANPTVVSASAADANRYWERH
jgi:predicted extracellular nuclease